MGFDGFDDRALDFFEGLEADNSKTYWMQHKHVYDTCVAGPMLALLGELESEFGPARFFRPYRDVRFSKDKSPYKTQAGAVVGDGQGTLYVHLSAAGLFVAAGLWHAGTARARRLRAAVADEQAGPVLQGRLTELTGAGFTVDGERLKRVPKPWDDAHPRADLLRLKTLTASRSFTPAPWLHTAEAKDRVVESWRAFGPLNDWLGEHVPPD